MDKSPELAASNHQVPSSRSKFCTTSDGTAHWQCLHSSSLYIIIRVTFVALDLQWQLPISADIETMRLHSEQFPIGGLISHDAS